MTWLFGDSFDHYATTDVPRKYVLTPSVGLGGYLITAGAGIDATKAFVTTNGNGHVGCAAPVNASTVFFGFAWKVATTDQSNFATVWDGVNDRGHVCLRLNSDGSISAVQVYHNNAFFQSALSTVLGSSAPGKVTPGIWHHLEAKIKVDQTVGEVEVHLNGETILNLSGVDTSNTDHTTTAITVVGFGTQFSSTVMTFDDFWVCDDNDTGDGCNDFLGPLISECLFPNAVGNSSGFTPTSGSNYQNVDDPVPDDDATTVSSAVVTTRDTYGHPALARVAIGIRCVQHVTTAKRATGATRAIAHVIRTASTDYDGDAIVDHYLPTQYQMQLTPRGKNPNTTSDWTKVEVDATEFGQVVTV